MPDAVAIGVFIATVLHGIIESMHALADVAAFNREECKKISGVAARDVHILETYSANFTVDRSNIVVENFEDVLKNIRRFVKDTGKTSKWKLVVTGESPKRVSNIFT